MNPSHSVEMEFNPMRSKQDRNQTLQSTNNELHDHDRPSEDEKPFEHKESYFQDVMIFDSIQIHFRPEIFFFQLFIHIFIMFSWLSPNPSAQGFSGWRPMAYFYNHFLTIVVYIMVISYFMSPTFAYNSMSGAVWIPLIYFIQHKLIVACKYASMSPSEYKRYMSCHDESILEVYKRQLQLILAWLNRDESVLEFELGAAAIRAGAKISEVYFVLPNPKQSVSAQSQIHYWHAFLRGREFVDFSIENTDGLVQRSDGRYQISVYDICTALVRRCDTSNFGESSNFYVISVFCVITIIIPFAIMMDDRSSWPNKVEDAYNHWMVLFYLTSTLINSTFGVVVYNLLYVAIFDVMRQLKLMEELSAFIRISDLALSTEGVAFEKARFESIDDPSLRTDDAKDDSEIGDESTQASFAVTSRGYSTATTSAAAAGLRTPESPKARLSDSLNERNLRSILTLNRPSTIVAEGSRDASRHVSIATIQSSSYPRASSHRQPSINSQQNTGRCPVQLTAVKKTAQIRDLTSLHWNIGLRGSVSAGEDMHRMSTTSSVCSASRASWLSTTSSLCSNNLHAASKQQTCFYAETAGERLAVDGGRAAVPRLSFDTAQNVLAWTYARLVIQNFGDRFRFRIDIYVGGTIAIMVLLIICALLALFSYGNQRRYALKSAFFLQALAAINLVYFFLMTIAYLSAQMNDKYKEQKQLLTRHGLRYRTRWLSCASLCSSRRETLTAAFEEAQRRRRQTLRRALQATRRQKKQQQQHQQQQQQQELPPELPQVNPQASDKAVRVADGEDKAAATTNAGDVGVDDSEDAEQDTLEDILTRDMLYQCYQRSAEEAQEIVEHLEALTNTLDVENELKPFKIFGMEASTSLVMTIVTSYVSFIGLVISLFTSDTSLVGQDLESF